MKCIISRKQKTIKTADKIMGQCFPIKSKVTWKIHLIWMQKKKKWPKKSLRLLMQAPLQLFFSQYTCRQLEMYRYSYGLWLLSAGLDQVMRSAGYKTQLNNNLIYDDAQPVDLVAWWRPEVNSCNVAMYIIKWLHCEANDYAVFPTCNTSFNALREQCFFALIIKYGHYLNAWWPCC